MVRTLQAELKQTRPYRSLAQEAYISLVRTAALVSHAFEDAFKPFGITATQYNVLRILRGAGEGGLCRNEIRDRMITPVPDVTRLIDRLEHMALVDRTRSGSDRRLVTTRITRDGLALLARLDEPVNGIHERQFGHVAQSRLRTLVALLGEIRRADQQDRRKRVLSH